MPKFQVEASVSYTGSTLLEYEVEADSVEAAIVEGELLAYRDIQFQVIDNHNMEVDIDTVEAWQIDEEDDD